MKDSKHAHPISIVVIGRNEGVRLARCLDSIRAIDDPGFDVEVIYVDSSSSDGSCELALNRHARVTSVTSTRPTAAIARNAGWRVASGELILFLDGDTILDPAFLKNAIPYLASEEHAVVFGDRREIQPTESIYDRVLDLDWISPVGPADYCGGDALIRRDVLEKVGGYDEGLIAGEEPEMCRRIRELGFNVEHIGIPMTRHRLSITRFTQYWRRATRTGYAYAEVSARFSATSSPLWKDEVRRNISRASGLLAISFVGLLASVLFASMVPIALSLVVLLALCLRSAYKMKWKGTDLLTLALYGLHSQFQHIPILVGQLQFHRDRRSNKRRRLIEYKEASQ